MRSCARLVTVVTLASCVALLPAAAQAAIGITRAELQGTQLRVEGRGALPSHAITLDPGGVSGTTDSSGAFRIQISGYVSPTCTVTVTDGATTMSATLAGCTPATTTPPPPPVVTPPPPVVTPPPPPPPTATGPAAVLTPSTLTFPPEPTGTASPTQVTTLSNPGTAALFINAISPRGVAVLDYNIVNDQCVGTSVAPGASCTLTVQFTPTADGNRPSTYAIVDNAANSPQVLTVTGTGLGGATGPTPLAIATAGLPCAGGVCDVSAGFSFTVGNFYAGLFQATGGTAPYTYSAVTPPGLSFTAAGLLSGVLPTVGTFPFSVTVHDSATPTAGTTVLFSMKVTPVPPPSPPGCQQGSTVRAALTGASIGGVTPSGQAREDESKLTACGGYGVLTVSVSNVNLPNGTVLWVYLDSQAVGTITLSARSGSIRPYNLGRLALRFDSVTINNGPPPTVLAQPSVLSGGSFR